MSRVLLAVAGLLLPVSSVLFAADWTRFRGPSGDGTSNEMGLPTEGAVRALLSRAQARLSGLLSRPQES